MSHFRSFSPLPRGSPGRGGVSSLGKQVPPWLRGWWSTSPIQRPRGASPPVRWPQGAGIFSSGLAAPGESPPVRQLWGASYPPVRAPRGASSTSPVRRPWEASSSSVRWPRGGASSTIHHAQGGIFSGSAASEGIFFFFGLTASGVIFFSGLALKFEEDMVFKCPLKIVLLTPKDFNILLITIAQ